MNNPLTPPLHTTGSVDTAAIEATHLTLPHQRPSTPLGILGKFPLEVRSQIYRDIFVQAKVHLKAQRPNPRLLVSVGVLQVLEVSKALRIDGQCFLQASHFPEEQNEDEQDVARHMPYPQTH